MAAKVYPIPEISDILLLKQLKERGLEIVRYSKDCIKLVNPDPIGSAYKRYYSFHLDFDKKEVSSMNINEYTSNYKRATIWVDVAELNMLLSFEKELTELLQSDSISK